jgi:hypothetical protein
MACEINASPSNGLVQSADGSGIIKLKSNGVTTNALAWVNFNGTGTVAIRSSYNVSSITDNGTGDYTVNFATALSDANFVVNCGVNSINLGYTASGAMVGATSQAGAGIGMSTSQVRVITGNTSSALNGDFGYVFVSVFGN